jgi:hypothetical protein
VAGQKSVEREELPGKFVYTGSMGKQGEYISIFVSKRNSPAIKYFGYSDERRADFFLLSSKKIRVSHKLDPASIKIYKIKSKGLYTVFIGKSQSASGSGVQVTYFIVNRMDKRGQVLQSYEFESRFGNINSLIEIDNIKALCYYKMTNAEKINTFLLAIYSVETNQQVVKGSAMIKYELNDSFVIVSNSLLTLAH